VERLREFLAGASRLLVLTGAGVSTDSGIPDYRGPDGAWKHRRPILYQDFVRSEQVRRRYWGRSAIGWRRVSSGRPNVAHEALARLEARGRVQYLVTQNVDGLHQRAGSRRVIDLHGRLDEVECLGCGARIARAAFQARLEALNPAWQREPEQLRPDGDVELHNADYERFEVPDCARCGGVLKPSVVFFGENVPRPRLACAMEQLAGADALLVVGSSLMVFSGYRFVREALRAGKPVAVLNQGTTRADAEVDLKVERPCGPVLNALA
jgi:NAD-dependent SIR2 family protein deacetylase